MSRHLSPRCVKRFARESRGANFIEAALITPLLLLLTFGIIDFASLFYTYLALENGISQATRFVVTGRSVADPGTPGAFLNRQDSIKTAMRMATPTLTISDSAFVFAHMSPGGTVWVSGPGGPGDLEKVTVNYDYSPMTPLLEPFFAGGQIHFTVDSAMKNENF